MEDKPKIVFNIDGKEVSVDEGCTILEAAQRNGIHIPTLCHHKALSNYGGCRMCLVEVDGAPKLAASCVTPVRNGIQVVTSNDYILECRRTILEYVFAERNHNCMFCPQSGDCELQRLAYELQMDHLTVSFSFNEFPTDVTSEYMAIDHSRCILCGRCVRACKEIAGASVLNFQNRGPKSLVGMDLSETREASTCFSCGVCVQVCPTGAMVNRYRGHYAVKGHPKDWQTVETVCSRCGLLCKTVAYIKENNLIKIEGNLTGSNGRPDRGQLCYKGRFESLKNKIKKLNSPMLRDEQGVLKAVSWDEILKLVSGRLNEIKEKEGGAAIFGLASSQASNEDLVFFKELMTRGWSAGHLDTFDGTLFRTLAGALKEEKGTFREAPWKMIPEADVVVMLGADPCQSHPVISSLLRKGILERSQKVAVLGQTDPIPPYIPYYLPVGEETLPQLISALRKGLRGTGDVHSALEKAGLDDAVAETFHDVVRILSDSMNPLFIVGEKFTGLQDPSLLTEVMALAKHKGRCPDNSLRLIILKPCGNSAGAWKLGVSTSERTADKGKWKGGLVLLSGPDDPYLPALDGLNQLCFIAAISPYFTESLADKVAALIPRPSWMEEEGTFTSIDGHETAYRQKILQAPDGVMDSWQIFMRLAERAGFKPEYQSWHELSHKAENEIRKQGLL